MKICMYKGLGDVPCGKSANPWCPLHPMAPTKEVEAKPSAATIPIVRSTSRQAWGIAFCDEQKKFRWCHGHGPAGWQRYTKRQAIMDALKSSNASFDGPYFPLPLVDVHLLPEDDIIDIQRYTGGPYSDAADKTYILAFQVLAIDPDIEFLQLEQVVKESKRLL